jgi:hypothetical protein
MRFMMMVIPKGYESAAADAVASAEDLKLWISAGT